MMMYTTDENVEEEIRGVDSLLGKQVDGLIIAPSSTTNTSHIMAAQNAGVAVVLVDRPLKIWISIAFQWITSPPCKKRSNICLTWVIAISAS